MFEMAIDALLLYYQDNRATDVNSFKWWFYLDTHGGVHSSFVTDVLNYK